MGRLRNVQSLQVGPKFIYGQDIQRSVFSLALYEEVAGGNQFQVSRSVRGRIFFQGQMHQMADELCSSHVL